MAKNRLNFETISIIRSFKAMFKALKDRNLVIYDQYGHLVNKKIDKKFFSQFIFK